MNRGRIHPDDIAAVRARTDLAELIGSRVTLKRVGANLTGLCPFHDDSSPSFSVSPERGLWSCFGCGMGGDAISFVRETEGLPFVDAVLKLADAAGIQVRFLDADPGYVAPPPGQRARLVAANTAAAAWFVSHLPSAEAEVGRTYLLERNFGPEVWADYGIGYAPIVRDGLQRALIADGFTVDELVLAGLLGRAEDGRVYDRFRGRLVWPIRELGGDIVGFGARKLREEDTGPKWLNTPDTPLYRKSEVLYGIDRARKDIAARQQVVVVEGYGDVMAAQLAGVTTAVATCGTAFGDGHIRIVRRLLRDSDAYTGKVVFTFDGDAAGQKAALRAFKDHAKFTAQTYVAVAPDNMDPCDLRLHRGDQAVRDLVASAVPLVEFVIRSTLAAHDTTRAEGRVTALRATAPLVAGIKDPALRTEYARRLSGWLTLPDHTVRTAVAHAARMLESDTPATYSPPREETVPLPDRSWRPDPADPALAVEREAAKVLLQYPTVTADWASTLSGESFPTKAYRGVYALAARAAAAHPNDAAAMLAAVQEAAAGDPAVASFVHELAVEELHCSPAQVPVYAADALRRLQEARLDRAGAALRARLADADPETAAGLLTEVMAVDAERRALRRR